MGNLSPIVIGCDHAGFALKELIKVYLTDLNCEISDCGAYSDASVDYPDYAAQVARKIASGEFSRGILICGTGIGMSMAANRLPGVRAALCNDLFSAIMSRRHNNANILVMGGRVIGPELAKAIVRAWIETPFEGGRHQNRIDKMDCIEI
jgi:ribose 5-phosphate isomerase B